MLSVYFEGASVVSVEARRETWAVDADATPPLDLTNPIEDERVGRFVLADVEVGVGR